MPSKQPKKPSFDEILSFANQEPDREEEQEEPTPEPAQPKPEPKAKKSSQKQGKGRSPWDDLNPPDKEPTVRLNVDIPIGMNDQLATEARRRRMPKTELVRHLLKWALDELPE